MSSSVPRYGTRQNIDLAISVNWNKIGKYYFVKPPQIVKDQDGNVVSCNYGAFDMVYKDDVEGHSLRAKGIWPPRDACIPYGGAPNLLSKEEAADIYGHNKEKYGGASRTHYWLQFILGKGDDNWQHVDGHPRHARHLGYPENCCWPGTRVNTVGIDVKKNKDKANGELDRFDSVSSPYGRADFKFPLPEYPYIHWPIYFVTTKQVNEGDELLVLRYENWTKNANTRVFGKLLVKPSGSRKKPKKGDYNLFEDGTESIFESNSMVTYIIVLEVI